MTSSRGTPDLPYDKSVCITWYVAIIQRQSTIQQATAESKLPLRIPIDEPMHSLLSLTPRKDIYFLLQSSSATRMTMRFAKKPNQAYGCLSSLEEEPTKR